MILKRISLIIFIILFNFTSSIAEEQSISDTINNSAVRIDLFWTVKSSKPIEESNALGLLVSEKGYVLTCYHCVALSEKTAEKYGISPGEIADSINIVLLNKGEEKSYPAKIIAVDEWRDLAILKPYENVSFYGKARMKEKIFFDKEDTYYASTDPENPWNSINSGKLLYPVLNDHGKEVMGFKLKIKSGSSGTGIFNSRGNLIGLIYAKGSLNSESNIKDIALAIPVQSIILFLRRNNIINE